MPASDSQIGTMEELQAKLLGFFRSQKDKIPECGTLAAYLEIFEGYWTEEKKRLAEIENSQEENLKIIGELETKNDAAVEQIKTLEDANLRLTGQVKKLSFWAQEAKTTVEVLNNQGTYIGRRSSGDMETITIPGDLDIFNPKGVEWSDEFGETLAVFEGGFKVGLDFLRKIQELHQDDHKKQLAAEELKAYRKKLKDKFVGVLKKQGVTWDDVPMWLKLMFDIEITAGAARMRFQRNKKDNGGEP